MVSELKRSGTTKLAGELKAHSVIALADLSGLPSKELQEIRKALRGKARIVVTKKSVIQRAIASCGKEGVEKLAQIEVHVPSLVIGNENAFRLYKVIAKSKSKTYAKVGDIAPYDLIAPAGETNLPPGPAISDLQKAGIKSAIMGNKIVIREDSVVAKKGDTITDIIAGVLQKLDIKPMEIGMNVVAAYDAGTIFEKGVLAVSDEEYTSNIQKAYMNAFNLAYNAGIYVKEIIPQKLFDSYVKSLNLGINTNFFGKDTIDILLKKANLMTLEAAATAQAAAEAPKEQKAEAKEEKKDEKKEEEAAEGLGALFG